MAKVINTKIDDGILIFTFTNNEDEVFSSFKLNPTDINVAARAEELAEYFEQLKDSIQKVTSSKEMADRTSYRSLSESLRVYRLRSN